MPLDAQRAWFSMDLENKIEEKEKKRKSALARQDALSYVKLCDKLGVDDIEDGALYNRGLMELDFKSSVREQKDSELDELVEKEEKRQYHLGFLKRAKLLYSTDLSSSALKKKSLLSEFYPNRFGNGSTQDLARYTDAEIGKVFKSVYNSYSRKYNK
jgi:hypothetical protein